MRMTLNATNPAITTATVVGQPTLDLFDVNGRHLSTIHNGTIDCTAYPAGIYTIRTPTGATARLVIVK